jgi:hypothetical protein
MNVKILLVLLLPTLIIAGESVFGINNKSIGFLSTSYSSSGMARSYEIANVDSTQLNFINYSTWTAINHTTYSVKFGYHAAFGRGSNESKLFNDVANFEGGFFSIPVIPNKSTIGVGLLPYTTIDQRLSQENIYDTYSLREELLLRGGLNKATLNFSYNLFSTIYFGLGYEYTFGNINKTFRGEYINSTILPFSFEIQNRFFGHGIIFSSTYSPNTRLNIGLVIRPRVSADLLIKGSTNSDEVNKSQKKQITLPEHIDWGMQYKLNDRLRTGFDVLYQGWGKGFAINDTSYSSLFGDYLRIGFGIERQQSSKLFVKLSEQLDYRIGMYYSMLNFKSNKNKVEEYGLTFGFSLPIQRFISKIDISGAVGKRGDLSRNYYEETFIGFGISISASEMWFSNIDE